jgi:hypothetical protein
VRIVLSWETDATEAGLRVIDRDGLEHYSETVNPIVDGVGVASCTLLEADAFPYRVGVQLYRKNAAGVTLGSVQVIRHDGRGKLTVAHLPVVIQTASALLELPRVAR